jgi:hypothetical protein
VQYVLLGLVIAIITASVAAWMKMTGGDDGVAEAELVDFGDFDMLPLPNDFPARHAMVTVAARHIPLIFVSRGPRLGQAWLHFADGTELLAEERVLGVLGFLAFDVAWHGPTAIISLVTPTDAPRSEDCWVSVGRLGTTLKLLDAHHPQALLRS